MSSVLSPYYMGITKSFDEQFIAVSEQHLGQVAILDTARPYDQQVILRIYFGNSKNIQDLAITNGNNLVVFTNTDYQIINFTPCIEDPAKCLSCNLDYFISVSPTAASSGGIGTRQSPYRQSRQIIESQYKL